MEEEEVHGKRVNSYLLKGIGEEEESKTRRRGERGERRKGEKDFRSDAVKVVAEHFLVFCLLSWSAAVFCLFSISP
jgi:hypothetical protein